MKWCRVFSSHLVLDLEIGEEFGNLRSAHLARMELMVEKDEAPGHIQ
jgi:hypothetical protein